MQTPFDFKIKYIRVGLLPVIKKILLLTFLLALLPLLQGASSTFNLTLNVSNGGGGGSSTFNAFGMPNPPPAPNNHLAIPAIAWDTSVGANICGQASCCYGCPNGTGSQATDIAQIQYTGVLTLRSDHSNLSWLTSVAQGAATGPNSVGTPKYCMLMFNTAPNPTTASLTTVELAAAKTLNNAGVLRCLEGLNEPETQPDIYNGATCDNTGNTWQPCAQIMHDFYLVLRGEPTLNNIAMYGISDNGAEGTGDYGTQWAWSSGIQGGNGTYNNFYPLNTVYSNGGVDHQYNSGQPLNRANLQWECGSPNENVNCHSPFYVDYITTWAHGYNGI